MENFLDSCRVCLDSSNILTPLSSIVYQNLSSQEIFNYTLSSKITDDEKLPKNVCATCIEDLIKIYNFHQKFEDTLQKLEEFYRTTTTDNLDVRLNYSETQNNDDITVKLDPVVKFDNDDNNDFYVTDCEDNLSNNGSISEYLKLESKRNIKDEKAYKCSKCKETFDTELELRDHTETVQHRDIRNHACEICKKVFTRSKLREHMRVHSRERPYKCKVCSQSFSVPGNLKRHMMTHTGEKPHICEVCGKAFIQSCTLQKHQTTHKISRTNHGNANSFDCEICGRQFKRHARYKTHITKHSNIPEPKTINNGIIDIKEPAKTKETTQNYSCDICQNSYKSKVILKAHYLTHGDKSYLCSHCGKGFVTKSALQSHLMVHTGERPHTCAICKKAFAHIGTFDKHMLTHTGQKPYICQICGKSFAQYAHVKHHLRTHTGERPYVCPYCGKSFASKGNLTVHVRIHTGETPYVCPVCGRGYYDSTSMKRHWKGHNDPDYKEHNIVCN